MRIARYCGILLLWLGWVSSAQPAVKLPAIFGDHMVLQRDIPCPVWGTASPGEKVTVTAAAVTETTTAGPDGKWAVKLKSLPASTTPIELTVAGKNTLTFTDVLVGDVWLCGGQSNMAAALKNTGWKDFVHAPDDLSKANHPTWRLFTAVTLDRRVKCGQWQVCTPETAELFSAVAYYFAEGINEKAGVPLGLVQTAIAGSKIEGWITPASLRKPELSDLQQQADDYEAKKPALMAQFQNDNEAYKQQWKQWQAKVDAASPADKAALQRATPKKPRVPLGPGYAGGFKQFIAPLVPYGIKGMLWYQGEQNAGWSKLGFVKYRTLFPALITGWREAWGQGDFPFLFVQLPNYELPKEKTADAKTWAGLREAQAMALALPNTAMAVTLDIGQGDDLHPDNKFDIGRRLALAALKLAYGQDVVYSGPMFDSMKIEGDKVRIRLKHVGGGLIIDSPPPARANIPKLPPASELKGFRVAGVDKNFVPAQAKIENHTIVVWSDAVKQPVAVRYGFANNPEVNLYNNQQLPAAPFRTDDWEVEGWK